MTPRTMDVLERTVLPDRSAGPPPPRGGSVASSSVSLTDVKDVLAGRWRAILVSVLVATGLATTAGLILPDRYAATSTVVVSPLSNDPSVSVSLRDAITIATEREILQSQEVARLALDSLGRSGEGTGDLIASMGVVAPEGSQVLRVTVTADSPQEAATLTDAVAEAYLEFRRRGGTEMADRFIRLIDERVAELSTGSTDQAAREQIRQLSDQRHALSLFGQDPGRVIGHAEPPQEPSGPGLPLFVLAGLVGGLLLGVVVALARERVDRRVRFARRLAEDTGTCPVVLDDLGDVEGLRWLRRNITLLVPGGGTVLFVGTSGRRRGVDVVTALAEVARDSGYVVRVDDASELSPAGIDAWTRVGATVPAAIAEVQGSPGAAARLHLVDATRVTSPTSLSELADLADAMVVVASPRDLRRDVQLLGGLADRAAAPLLAVLTPGRG